MNNEQYEKLLARAERAKTLTEEISVLKIANPDDNYNRLSFRTNANDDLLPREMLHAAMKRGIENLIADREAELERVLNVQYDPCDADKVCPELPCDGPQVIKKSGPFSEPMQYTLPSLH